MKNHHLKWILPFLLWVVGCGPVAGNYPVQKTPSVKKLPDKDSVRDRSLPRVWHDEGRIHGFLVDQKSAKAMVDRMRLAESKGNKVAGRDARIFEPMALEELSYIHVRIYLKQGLEQRLASEDLVVTFTDGSSLRDQGCLLYPQMGNLSAPLSTFRGPITIRGRDDPDLEGRQLFIFLPAGALDKKIRSVKLAVTP